MNTDREIIYNIKEKKGISKNVLVKLLLKWQKKLEMKGWKLNLKIVDFKREDKYRQSGDFIANPKKKTATILMTWNPWRGDEEYTLVHEMIHVLVYEYDKYNENLILKKYKKTSKEYGAYMNKLEKFVHQLTRTFLGRSDR